MVTDFEVWPENWSTVQMFMRMGTQWTYAGMGTVTGLNYQSLDFLFKVYGIKKRREIMDGLQIMENAALRIMASKDGSP